MIAIKIEQNQEALRCDICGAVLIFTDVDVDVFVIDKELHYHYVECPLCDNQVRTKETL